jgi:hypothetical protein
MAAVLLSLRCYSVSAQRNILLEDIRCDKGETSYFIDGLQEQHIENLTLRNVTMGQAVGKEGTCDYVDCRCDTLTAPCPTCCTHE